MEERENVLFTVVIMCMHICTGEVDQSSEEHGLLYSSTRAIVLGICPCVQHLVCTSCSVVAGLRARHEASCYTYNIYYVKTVSPG